MKILAFCHCEPKLAMTMILLLGFSIQTSGFLFQNDLWQDVKSEGDEKKTVTFGGLSFRVSKNMTCKELFMKKFSCSSSDVSIILEEKTAPNRPPLALVRLLRKDEWLKSYKIFHYQELDTELSFGKVILQEASLYEMNNISKPILLRAFDISLRNNNFVSIQEKISRPIWPLIKNQIDDFELSISSLN